MYVCIYIHAGALGSNRIDRWPPAPIRNSVNFLKVFSNQLVGEYALASEWHLIMTTSSIVGSQILCKIKTHTDSLHT